MATKHFPKGLDDRMPDGDGQIHKKRGDTLVRTLRDTYGEDFARGHRSDTLLKKEGVDTLDQLIKKGKG